MSKQQDLNYVASKYSILHDIAASMYFFKTLGNSLSLRNSWNSGYIYILRIKFILSIMSVNKKLQTTFYLHFQINFM